MTATPGVKIGGKAASITSVIGGIAIAVSSFLPWQTAPGVTESANGWDLPVSVIYDNAPTESDLKLGMVFLVLGVLITALAFRPEGRVFRRILGAIALAAALSYAGNLSSLLDTLGISSSDLSDYLGLGAYVAGIGGLVVALKP